MNFKFTKKERDVMFSNEYVYFDMNKGNMFPIFMILLSML